jgi:hypothetical protein
LTAISQYQIKTVTRTTNKMSPTGLRLFLRDISCRTLGIKIQSKTFKYIEIRDPVSEIKEVKKKTIPSNLQYI